VTSAPAWRERPSLLQSRASRPRGGFSFQFNDLSEGAFSFEELDEQVQSLLLAGQASGEFSTLYTQFIPSSPAFALSIDRSTMGALNIDFQQAMQAIAILAGGNDSGLTYDGGQVRNISVQAADSGRSQLEDILSCYVGNREGELIQVPQFARTDLTSAPPVISHYNLYRTILVQGAEAAGRRSGQALAAIQRVFRDQNFNNIGSAFTGIAALQLSAGNASVLVFGLGILFVFLVLSAQYESYVTPVIILMTVPLAMLGALVFLALRSIDLNIYAQVGLVTLTGLAAKNGILIVELAEQQQRERGLVVADAVIAAAESRLRPILMTAIASLAGFLPLVLPTTVLSLGVVPPFYVVVKGLEERAFGPTTPEPAEPGA
jgi:multidrug efflux pump subunit AcrB